MSWPFRGLVLAVLLGWGIAPQLVCFVPEQTQTPSEMDCCKGILADCSGANMSQACCQTVVRTDAGIVARTDYNVKPHVQTADRTIAIAPVFFSSFDPPALKQSDHAPPPSDSSLILRI